MSNANNSTAVAIVEQFIQEDYEGYVYSVVLTSSLALLLYATMLTSSQEVEYMWSKRFSLPTLLYALARYGTLISTVLYLLTATLPETVSNTECNVLADLTTSFELVSYIGVQGLLVARAYSLCQGNKIVAAALGLTFLAGFIFNLYITVAFPGCSSSMVCHVATVRNKAQWKLTASSEITLLVLLSNISTISNDVVVFGVCLYNVWGIWKLKRESGIQTSNDLVTILFKQIVSRFCFVLFINLTVVIIEQFSHAYAVFDSLSVMEGSLSAILISEFTLDLRRQNFTRTNITSTAMDITLPRFHSFGGVLQHVHQSFMTEMRDVENITTNDSDITLESPVDEESPQDHDISG